MAFESVREGQLTEDKLKMGYWWVTHKTQVRKATALVLIVVDLALVGFAGFGFLDYYFGSGVPERQQLAQLARQYTNYAYFRQKMAPIDLLIEDIAVLNSSEGTYDIVARVTNQNMKQWVEFDYQFVAGEPLGPVAHDFVLPGSFKYIHQLGVRAAGGIGSPSLEMTNVAWRRVDAHVIGPDYAAWSGIRLNLPVSEVVFTPPDPTDPLTISRVTFNVRNATAFGYRRLGFFVSLIGPGGLSGVNYVTISDLRPGETRRVDASWFSVVPAVSSVEVASDVNIFDDRVYIPTGD